MKNILAAIALVCLLFASQSAHADKKTTKVADPIPSVLERVAAAAKCEDAASPQRIWCLADGWNKGTAAALPTNAVLVGLTLAIVDKSDGGKALTENVSVSAAAFGSKGEIKVVNITPSNDAEKKQMAEVVFSLAVFFKGKADNVTVSADMSGYLKSLKGTYKAKKVTGTWQWKGASQGFARKFGDNWIVVERSTEGPAGWWVSIVTPSWK
jgi:hypothetical protein